MDNKAIIQQLLLKIEQLETVVQELNSLVKRQAQRIVELEAEQSKYKNKKNSNNSHLPPSKDENRPLKNQSLRSSSGKKPGGQPGREGTTLKFSPTPDKIIEHRPDYCQRCGQDLSAFAEELVEKRQVIDIPIIQSTCIEHQVYRKICSCGHCTESSFPIEAAAHIQYGPGVQATVAYLHSRQYIPFERIKELFKDQLGLSLSIGSICNMITQLAQKAMPVYEQIKERISQAIYAGTDETSMKVNGKKHWFWTWQNERMTFIAHSDNRAFATIQKHFPEGLPYTVLQHDRYAAHFGCKAAAHQICLAHLLRDIQYLTELYPDSRWPKDFRAFIYQALALKKALSPADYYQDNQERNNLESLLQTLLNTEIDKKFAKAKSLQKSLKKCSDAICTFLYHPKVPPDNNGSERAIRNIKVKQKISGQFKSQKGANSFAVLRSVIDTVIKSEQNVFNALTLLAKN